MDDVAVETYRRWGTELPDTVDGVTAALVWEYQNLAAAQARILRLQARVADLTEAATEGMSVSSAELVWRSAAAELGAQARVSDRWMSHLISESQRAMRLFPMSVAALEAGYISKQHLDVIVRMGERITDDSDRLSYEFDALYYAEHESAGRLKAYARRLAEHYLDTPAEERHADACDTRCLRVNDLDDGMAEFIALLPAVAAHGMLDRYKQMARELAHAEAAAADGDPTTGDTTAATSADSTEDDTDRDSTDVETDDDGTVTRITHRTMAQLEADVCMDVALTGAPAELPDGVPTGWGSIQATIVVTVPATTLTGETDDPGFLPDGNTVAPSICRYLAGEADGWDRLRHCPVTGEVITVDRYKPSAAQRRYLRARDQRCRFPGCRMPARRSDNDHTRPYSQGGKTSTNNLACLCERHHTLKHNSTWRVRHLPGGILEWTSPTGRIYRDTPPAIVTFTASEPESSDEPPWMSRRT